ncbi:MAG: ribonuclease III domain-containing protein [Oscillospiraceae bacterium]
MSMNNEGIQNIRMLSPLGLAYIGDCIFELMVRERIIAKGNMPVHKLHKMTVSYVCASAQSKAFGIIEGDLSDEEIAIYKRGRNANGNHIPKNANPVDYRRATGLEALFGFLHLSGQDKRVSELFESIFISVNID